MTDDADSPDDTAGFDDIVEQLDEPTFDWDDDELEADQEEETRPVVAFRIGTDLFAVPGDSVREIMATTDSTPLPGAPAHVDGVIVVRRRVVGVLSMRKFLNLDASLSADAATDDPGAEPAFEDVSTDRTLIVETAHYTVGIRVDEITGLGEWPESSIDPETLPDNIRDSTRRYARGARQQNGTLCIYLDLPTLLDDAAVR